MRKLTDAEKRSMADLYNDDMPVAEIGRRFGVGERRVFVVLDELEIPRRKAQRSAELAAQVEALYREGKSYDEISAALGITYAQVAAKVHDLGLADRQPPVSEDERTRMLAMRDERGMSAAAIARELGRARKTVTKVLKDAGRETGDPKALPKEQITAAAERVRSGEEIEVVAEELMVRVSSLRRAFKRGGHDDLLALQYVVRHEVFTTPSPQAQYYLGLLMADGSRGAHASVQIALQAQDKEILEHLRDYIGAHERPLYFVPAREAGETFGATGDAWHLKWYSATHARELDRHGITHRKGKIGTRASDEMAASTAFWFGMVDGDGYITFNRDGTPVVGLTGCRTLCDQFTDWASSTLDCYRRSPSRKNDARSSWRVEYSGIPARRLCELFLSCGVEHSIPRKRRTAEQILTWISQQERNAERRVKQSCTHCGAEFERAPSKTAERPFCSMEHQRAYQAAIDRPENHRRQVLQSAADAQARWTGAGGRQHVARFKPQLRAALERAGVRDREVRFDLNQQGTVFAGVLDGRRVLVGATCNWKCEVPKPLRAAAQADDCGLLMLHLSPADPDVVHLAALEASASTSRVPQAVLAEMTPAGNTPIGAPAPPDVTDRHADARAAWAGESKLPLAALQERAADALSAAGYTDVTVRADISVKGGVMGARTPDGTPAVVILSSAYRCPVKAKVRDAAVAEGAALLALHVSPAHPVHHLAVLDGQASSVVPSSALRELA